MSPFANIKSFLASRRGSVLPIVSLAIVTLVGLAGAAIDTGRGQLLHLKLSSSLDAAGLAAGSTVSTTNLNAEAAKYLDANFANYMGSTLTNLTVSTNTSNTVISLSAVATLPTTFMKVFGIETVTVRAESEITRAIKGMELVLVLDGTGSMNNAIQGGGTKIAALRSAATDLVDTLYGEETSIENFWIGIVPFSQAVNIGSGRANWTTTSALNWGPTSWTGCVEAREAGGRDVTDDPPSVQPFPKYYSACAQPLYSWSNAWYGTNSARNNCATGTNLQYRTPLSTALGPNQFCIWEVTPLTASKSTVMSAIDAMQQGTGDTHINLGLVWGWRMLSPRWRNLWGSEMDANQLPLNYNAPLMNKVVILLSDGDNHFVGNNYTAYGTLSAGRLGTTNSSSAANVLNTRTSEVCTAMKNNNILIYSIALGTAISSVGKGLLQNCASQPEYYFDSPDAATLQSAFQQIGDSLASLRVSR